VICSAVDRRGTKYYFLPKGRRDAGEESGTGAEREGYEEVGMYDQRLSNTSLTCSTEWLSQPSPPITYAAPPTASTSARSRTAYDRRTRLDATHAARNTAICVVLVHC
jgi:hypothetical protein